MRTIATRHLPVLVLASALLSMPGTAPAFEFTHQPLTVDLDGVLYNVVLSGDLVAFNVDTGQNKLYAHNLGLGVTQELLGGTYWFPNAAAGYDHFLISARSHEAGLPIKPPELVHVDLRNLTHSLLVPVRDYDQLRSLDVTFPYLASLRDRNLRPQLYYTHAQAIELLDLVSGTTTIIEEIAKPNYFQGGFLLDTAFDGEFLAWIWCPDAYCDEGTLWAQQLSSGDRYELLTTAKGTQIRWIDMHEGLLIYTHGPVDGLQPTTISAINMRTGQYWDITSGPAFMGYQQVQGRYIVWEAFEPPAGCTTNCLSVENIYLHDLATGQTGKVTDEAGRHYFMDLQGDRVAYVDNLAGYERLVLAEFEIPACADPLPAALCESGRTLLDRELVRGAAWSDVTTLELPAATICGASAICLRNGDAAGEATGRQAIISLDGTPVISGGDLHYGVLSLARRVTLTSGTAHQLAVDLGDVPGTTLALRVVTSHCDADGDGFAADVDCNDADAAIFPGAAELCDGVDNDCDPTTLDGAGEPWLGAACDGPDADLCQEGVLSCQGGVQACSDVSGDAVELCDGVDNDCDGVIDERFNAGAPCSAGLGACLTFGVYVCTADGLGTECTALPGLPEPEACDGIDNDCNGVVDDKDLDGDGLIDAACGGSDPDDSDPDNGQPGDDADGDGVADGADLCPDSRSGAIVDAEGCAISQHCPPCDDWRSHGAFVSCVAHTTRDFRQDGLITIRQRIRSLLRAVFSGVGWPWWQGDCTLVDIDAYRSKS